MRLLFLDIDGVLTTTVSPLELVPSCVQRLQNVLTVSGARLVLSSSWRIEGIGADSEFQIRLKRVCREMDGHSGRFEDIVRRLHGATSSLPDQRRQDEIEEYVGRHEPDRFAAVDDWVHDFTVPPPPWLVLTDPDSGLDEAAEKSLLEILADGALSSARGTARR